MIALIGGGLLMFVTTFLESTPKENKKPVLQEEPPTTIINQEETKPATITSFDTTFTFEKGYTDNKNDLTSSIVFASYNLVDDNETIYGPFGRKYVDEMKLIAKVRRFFNGKDE